jgi:arginine decarboxylase
MPGERLGDAESPTIKFLLALEEFGKRFPGFEREVHGIEVDAQGQFWTRSVIESAAGPAQGKAKPRTRPATRAVKKTMG